MELTLFGHPVSLFSQKVFIALYENEIPFTLHEVVPGDERDAMQYAHLWPFKRIPVLTHGARSLAESSVIVEYVDLNFPVATRLLPEDAHDALEVRMLDRAFDNYFLVPLQKIIGDRFLEEQQRDTLGVERALATLDIAYTWLDQLVAEQTWAAGNEFSLADCAAAPALACAARIRPTQHEFKHLLAYRDRLFDRQSCKKALEAAEPYHRLLPLDPA